MSPFAEGYGYGAASGEADHARGAKTHNAERDSSAAWPDVPLRGTGNVRPLRSE